MEKYYKIPVEFVRIFEPNMGNLTKCNDKESIEKNLELIITTCPGENKYDPEFGCRIWELDFERVVSRSRWEEEFVKYIADAIRKYEPRVSDVFPRVTFVDTRRDFEFTGVPSIRKRADISIDATIISTGKKYCFFYSLYLGPLSSE